MVAPIPEDPELARVARFIPTTTVGRRGITAARALLRAVRFRPVKGIDIEQVTTTVDGRPVEVEIYRRAGVTQTLPVMIWLHGGGLVMGTHHDAFLCGPYVRQLDIAIVSVKYGLAPEDPFPAALEDIVASHRWVLDHGAEHQLDTSRVAIGGASAGGGLTAAAAQRLHDDGVELAAQLMVYPMLDDRSAVRDDIGDNDHRLWTKASNFTGWSAYLGHPAGQDETRPYAVPARRDDLSGLAPAWIGVGTDDLFHDEDVDYAERLRAAGVECELVTVPGGFHGFDALAASSTASREFRLSQLRFLASHLRTAEFAPNS